MSKHTKEGQAKLKALKEVTGVAKSASEVQHQFSIAIQLHTLRVEAMNASIQIMKEDTNDWNFTQITEEADKIFDYFQKDAKISNTDKKENE